MRACSVSLFTAFFATTGLKLFSWGSVLERGVRVWSNEKNAVQYVCLASGSGDERGAWHVYGSSSPAPSLS